MGGVVVCFALFLAAMAVCLVMGWSFLWALLLGLALFTLHGRKQGHSLQTMWGMAWSEGRKVLIVLRIFVFIGAITPCGAAAAPSCFSSTTAYRPSLTSCSCWWPFC